MQQEPSQAILRKVPSAPAYYRLEITDREADETGRLIREAIRIRKSNNMNRHARRYQLSYAWDMLLLTDVKNRKSVLAKTSDGKLKRRHYRDRILVVLQ